MSHVSASDLEVLRKQLGRQPRGVLNVETRCPAGHPQVVKVYPLLKLASGAEPFPTLFWLTCPGIIEQVSRLEHDGWISKLERFLQEDSVLRISYELNQRQYVAERWETLTAEDRHWMEAQGWSEGFASRGIGGLADWSRIKCLHLHYAHHLARENVIGQWLDEHYVIQPCAAL